MLQRIAIIGGGPSGLIASHSLLNHLPKHPPKPPSIALFDSAKTIGGTWVYKPLPSDKTDLDIRTNAYDTIIHNYSITGLYDSLMTNLPLRLMAFPSFPHENEAFVRHDQVCEYLRDSFRYLLDDERVAMKLGTRVLEVKVNSSDIFTIKSIHNESGHESLEQFDAVIVATGHYSKPRIPSIPGLLDSFTGKISHSQTYRSAKHTIDSSNGGKIVVVGAGASGIDIIRELSLELSSSSTQLIWSIPESVSTKPLPYTPPSNVTIKPPMRDITPTSITFTDATTTPTSSISHILFATGYNYTFPFLPPHYQSDIITPSSGIRNLSNTMFYFHNKHSRIPKLAFMTLPYRIVPFILAEYQSRFIANLWLSEPNELNPDSLKALRTGIETSEINLDFGQGKEFEYCNGLVRLMRELHTNNNNSNDDVGIGEIEEWRWGLRQHVAKLRGDQIGWVNSVI